MADSSPEPSDMPSPETRDETTIRLLKSRDPKGLHQLIEDHGHRVQWLLTREFDPPLLVADVEDAYSSALQKTWSGIGGGLSR